METRINREDREAGRASTTGALAGRKYLTSASGTVTYSMSVRDFLVIVVTASTFAMVVTLPSVHEARGKIYTFKLVTSGRTENFEVHDKDDSRNWTDLKTTTADDKLVLFSDGEEWHVLHKTGFAA